MREERFFRDENSFINERQSLLNTAFIEDWIQGKFPGRVKRFSWKENHTP